MSDLHRITRRGSLGMMASGLMATLTDPAFAAPTGNALRNDMPKAAVSTDLLGAAIRQRELLARGISR